MPSINYITPTQWKNLAEMSNAEESFPNGLKVSKTDNPLFFPVENTYQVGSSEIIALMSNAIAVGTGQTGSAPLYVFCKDGVYALFVDASGEMTYTNARVIARDVCNNARSVTPIDAGVVFTTDRGLMMIAGEQVQEIGQPAEGDVNKYWDNSKVEYTKIAAKGLTKVACLPTDICDDTDFLTYIKDGAIVNYNHNERELVVSNPTKDFNGYKYKYSYVLDRDGNWSRRYYTADEYVNNYPTSYRLISGKFFKVDENGSSATSLEQKKESDNKFFYLSNIIKLGSIGFKQAIRFVVRGYFESECHADAYVTQFSQSGDPEKVIVKGSVVDKMIVNDVKHIWKEQVMGAYYWREIVGGQERNYNYDGINIHRENGDDITYTLTDYYSHETTLEITRQRTYIGCYVFGSYDGRKWVMLGGNEKSGKFTDIGCKIERTDVKFFRVCLAGQVTGKTRIDYMEMSSAPSMLNTKIR